MTELAPDCRISGHVLAARGPRTTIQASGLSWRTVRVASTLESSRSVVMMTWLASDDARPAQHLAPGGVAGDHREPVGVRVLQRHRARVDDHDRLAVLAVVDQGLDRAAALGAVADDDDVLAHLLPPPGDPEHLAALRGEHLEGGPDQQHQEGDAQRGDHERVDQPGVARDGRDVAVPGRAERDGRVVDRVDQVDRVVRSGRCCRGSRRGRSRPAGRCRPGSPPPAACGGRAPTRASAARRAARPGAGWPRRCRRSCLARSETYSTPLSRTDIRCRSRCTSSSRARVVAFCGKTLSKAALTAAPISTAIATR